MNIGTDLHKAAQLLRSGKVVAIPTETVYGLAANAFDPEAVIRIYEIKKRPRFNPLIVHVHSWEMLDRVAAQTDRQLRSLAEAFWPGPLTILVPRSGLIHSIVTAGSDLVAVRMPNHPMTLELMEMLDFPLAAPSANLFGKISPTTAAHVDAQLHDQVDYILDGGTCSVGVESTIIKINTFGKVEILRPGGISAEMLASVTGYIPETNSAHSDTPEAPGMLKSHYAPVIPMMLGDILPALEKNSHKKIALLTFNAAIHHPAVIYQVILSENSNLHEAARNLFACLHRLEQSGADLILAEKVPSTGIGAAINDRLERASADA